MLSIHFLTPLNLVALLPAVNAWGALGHMSVGAIASNFVADSTKAWAQQLLAIDEPTYLASVAPWADQYRETSPGRFTEPFHFIDAEDTPPTACSSQYARDCGEGGCLASAILNYTQRVQDTTLSGEDQAEALKFLIHFFGDMTQPLHNEAVDRGGNEIKVLWGEKSENLHAVWDTNMLEALVGGYQLSDAVGWAANLTNEIVNGTYTAEKDSWLSGLNVTDPIGSAMAMSSDANAFVCSYVLASGIDALEGQDLSGDYYHGAVPIFSLQIAKGGYRLAAWLDMLATGSMGGGSTAGAEQHREDLR